MSKNHLQLFIVILFIVCGVEGCNYARSNDPATAKEDSQNPTLVYSQPLGGLRVRLTSGLYEGGRGKLCYDGTVAWANVWKGRQALDQLDKGIWSKNAPKEFEYAAKILESKESRAVYVLSHDEESEESYEHIFIPYPDNHIELFGPPPGQLTNTGMFFEITEHVGEQCSCQGMSGRREADPACVCAIQLKTCASCPCHCSSTCNICLVADGFDSRTIAEGICPKHINFDDSTLLGNVEFGVDL